MGASQGEKHDAVLALDVNDAQLNDDQPTMSAWKAYWVRFISLLISNLD
jgi:ATP-binding cassette subfamily B (MDR/TAP) protein 1